MEWVFFAMAVASYYLHQPAFMWVFWGMGAAAAWLNEKARRRNEAGQ